MNLFKGSSHAAAYSKFRPVYPSELLGAILEYLGEKHPPPFQHAFDVGCGTGGQSTRYLADHFQNVTGVDASEAQIQEANKNEKIQNITYKVGTDSSLPGADSSTDLVTAAQAAHWFNLENFYKEVDRVLRPNGCLAIYGYTVPRIVYKTNEVHEAASKAMSEIHQFYYEHGDWDVRRKIVDDRFFGQIVAYDKTKRLDDLHMDMSTTVAGVIGYLESWSSYQAYIKRKPDDLAFLTGRFKDKLLETLGNPDSGMDTPVILRCPIFLLLSRKPAKTL